MFGWKAERDPADPPFIQMEVDANRFWTYWDDPETPLMLADNSFNHMRDSALSHNEVSEFILLSMTNRNIFRNVEDQRNAQNNLEFQQIILPFFEKIAVRLKELRDQYPKAFARWRVGTYFGKEAVRAVRAFVVASTCKNTEVACSDVAHPNGDLALLLWDNEQHPWACIPHRDIVSVCGDPSRFEIELENGVISYNEANGWVSVAKHDADARMDRSKLGPPQNDFRVASLLRYLREEDRVVPSDWRMLVEKFMPAHLGCNGASDGSIPPCIEEETTDGEKSARLLEQILFSYRHGIFWEVDSWLRSCKEWNYRTSRELTQAIK